MIDAYVTTTALKISNEIMPDNPDVLYYSIITIVNLIDNTFRNWNISYALKHECITESMLKNLNPVLAAAGAEYTTNYIYEIVESYEKSLE